MTEPKKRNRRKSAKNMPLPGGTMTNASGYMGKRAADKILAAYVDRVATETASEVGKRLNLRYAKAYKHLETDEGLALKEELEKELAQSAVRVRHKAMAGLERLLDSNHLSDALRLQAYRFVLQHMLENLDGPTPDQLEFEAVITETGVVEKREIKVYHKTTTVKREA